MSDFKWRESTEAEKERQYGFFGPKGKDRDTLVSVPFSIRLPPMFRDVIQHNLENMETRPSDIWVVSYPKSGTTLTQEVAYHLSHKDVKTAEEMKSLCNRPIDARSPFLEYACIEPDARRAAMSPETAPVFSWDPIAFAASLPHDTPRVIKTHMPFEFIPKSVLEHCKVLCPIRNVMDVANSYFHHYKVLPDHYDLNGDIDDFFDMFINGELQYGDYWSVVKSAWKRRNHPNVKIIWYEDLRKDFKRMIKEINEFANLGADDAKIEEVAKFLQIDSYRQACVDGAEDEGEKEFLKGFVRKGKVGDWKDSKASESSKAKLLEWAKKNVVEDMPMKLD